MTSFITENITPPNGYFQDWLAVKANKLSVGGGEIKMFAPNLPPSLGSTSLKTDGDDLTWTDRTGKIYNIVSGLNPLTSKNWIYNVQPINDVISLNFQAPSEILTIPPNHGGVSASAFSVLPDMTIKYYGDTRLFLLNCNFHFKIAIGINQLMDVSVIIMVNNSTLTQRKVTSRDDGINFVPLSITTFYPFQTNDIITFRCLCSQIATVNIEQLDICINQISP